MNTSIINNRIKALMEDFELTQNDLAEKLNITQTTVSRYLSGARKIDIDTLSKISDIFDVSLDYLSGKSDTKRIIKTDKTGSEEANLDVVRSAFHVEGTDGLSDEDIEAVNNIIRQLKEKNKKK